MSDDPKLATPTPAARAETRAMAAAVIEAVRSDVGMPLGLRRINTASDGLDVYDADDVESLVMRLAMEVVALQGEYGHSERFLAAEIAVNDQHRETNRRALDLLGVKYPGLCNEYVWGGGITEGIEALRRQLAAMTAARDAACNLAGLLAGSSDAADDRIAELRKVGGDV